MNARLTKGLKRGEIAVVGWQCAHAKEPEWLTRVIARNIKKRTRRKRYDRQYARRGGV